MLPRSLIPFIYLHTTSRIRPLGWLCKETPEREVQSPMHKMQASAPQRSTWLRTLLSLLLTLPILSSALKFDMFAHPGHESAAKERCIRNFVAQDTLVVVTTTVDGHKGDGQVLNMHVCILPLVPCGLDKTADCKQRGLAI